jgi:hypothetical protein
MISNPRGKQTLLLFKLTSGFLSLVFFVALSSCTIVPVSAASKNDEERYTITLLAYSGGTIVDKKGSKSLAGHASISVNRAGVWGFYPSTPGKLITKRGLLQYSTEFPRTQEYVNFMVDASIMNKISELLLQWENNPPYFAIPFNDCVSFIYRVCDIIGLKYNPLLLLPIDAIRYIGHHNDQYHIYKAPEKIRAIHLRNTQIKAVMWEPSVSTFWRFL